MFKKLVLLAVIYFQFSQISAQNLKKITFVLDEIPKQEDSNSMVYIAGDFNNWNPVDTAYRFKLNDFGKFQTIIFTPLPLINYKITRGSWDKVECNNIGEDLPNRIVNLKTDTIIFLKIAAFQDYFASNLSKITRSAQVHLLDSAFYIPQLNLNRRIWIYLPKSYQKSKNKFPVIYMQDGQNLFDKSTSGYGEWGVDEVLDSLSIMNVKESIIVGIDHGGENRLTEYNPFDNKQFGKGKGDQYADFIVKTLKPFVDEHYRTFKNKKHTSIAGSSMGALISMYTIAKYPTVFGNAGIFSPSFWIAPTFYDYLLKRNLKKSKIYFVAGQLESEDMVSDIKKIYDELILKGSRKSNLKLMIKPDGKHSEWFWHREFPEFYKWLINQ